ncbi:MAG: porin family protein [Saprospiraceae bacterium]
MLTSYNRFLFLILLLIPSIGSTQVGLKFGLNFANVTKTSDFNSSSRSGFHGGIFMATNPDKIIGAHIELLYSKQGYNFKDKNNSGSVDLNYLLIPAYISFNFTRYLSIMGGLNIAYLIQAGVDTIPSTTGGTSGIKISDYFKKLDFGFGIGAETHPLSGLVLGARLNYSLGNLVDYVNDSDNFSKENFIPKVNVKNNLFQVYVGWLFEQYYR